MGGGRVLAQQEEREGRGWKKGKQWRGGEENTVEGSGKVMERLRNNIKYAGQLENTTSGYRYDIPENEKIEEKKPRME